MDEILIKEQDKKFSPKIGEFIYDKHNLIVDYAHTDITTKVIPLMNPPICDPFSTLERMGINSKKLLDSNYPCPFKKGNYYYGIVPIGLITNDPKPYRQAEFSNERYDWIFDFEWHTRFFLLDIDNKPNSIMTSFLGHGFNSGILPCDGSNNIVNVLIELSNGEFIIAKTFEWYNK
jgi:hypothetical protein